MPSPAPPSRKAPRPRRRWLLLVAAALVALLVVAALQGRRVLAERALRAEVEGVLAEFRKQLPMPHGPGLVFEQVLFEGDALVMVVRAQKRRVSDPEDPAARAAVARAEQALLRPFCRDAGVAYLLARGVTLTRRFIDRDGARFFDVSLTARDCATTSGESSP